SLIHGHAAAHFDASGTLTGGTFQENDPFTLHLDVRSADVAELGQFAGVTQPLTGTLNLSASVSGTRANPHGDGHLQADEPSGEADVHLNVLALDNGRSGDFYVDAVAHGRQLDLKAHADSDRADLTLAGSVMLEHDFPADLNLAFHHLDADSLLRLYLPGKITGHSAADGTLQVRGPLRTPRDLKVAAEIQSFSVEVGHVQVQNVGPIRFEVADQTVLLENLHLAGSGTDFTAHGRAHLTGARELDLRLDGSVNMTLLQSLNPKILARGTLGVNLDASGTLSQPVLQGRLEVKNTFVSHNDFPSGLSDL